ASARASALTVGTVNGGNCAPFDCSPSFSVTRYQQVYSAAAFGDPTSLLSITDLTFFIFTSFGGGQFGGSSFAVSLSTTSAPVQALSLTMDDNVGADNVLFWTGTLTGDVEPALTLSGGPFLYDPLAGNLLMDISISGGVAQFVFQGEDDTGALMSRMFSNGTSYADEAGLVTQFTYTSQPRPAAVPEPASLALLATGLLAVRRLKARLPA
ncbi:MAG: PEP-CTERM sorting domain-containing protein, partial [Vicinamibacterales bacterium]